MQPGSVNWLLEYKSAHYQRNYLTRDRLFAYCQKAEGDDRLLLLFLFGFLYSVTIDGITYVLGQDFSFSSPLCKVYKKLFPDVALFLYNNGFIPDTNMRSLKNFLYDYYSSTPPFRHRKRKKHITTHWSSNNGE